MSASLAKRFRSLPTNRRQKPISAGVPSNRGGHGIPQKIVIEELSGAGLQVEKIVEDWPEDSYCVLFVKK